MSANANFNALNIGHANVFHLCNKLHDVCRLLNGSPPLHLLGLSETRLGVQPDSQVFINNYHFFRKDAKLPGEVGLGIYVHKDITQFVTRRVDLESEGVECMWLQFKRTDKDSALLVSFVYRNPAATYAWYDDFVRMMDVVTNRHPKANFIIMGDFNIDFLKPQPSWKSTVSLHGLTQLVSQPTRITPTSSTLLDHIYVNNTDRISNIQVSDVSISDHCPILCSWSCKIPKPAKSDHTTIQYRCFKRFDKNVFLADLSCTNFANIHNCINPNDALNMFYDMFMPIVDRHAPLRRKRVKHQTVPGWMNADLVNAMKLRDKLKKR
jgi:exonuclease III